LNDGEQMRLRHGGSASTSGFAFYLASTGQYQYAILPTNGFAGTPEDALDCTCGLYLTDPMLKGLQRAPHTEHVLAGPRLAALLPAFPPTGPRPLLASTQHDPAAQELKQPSA
jgi:hypothetical protein